MKYLLTIFLLVGMMQGRAQQRGQTAQWVTMQNQINELRTQREADVYMIGRLALKVDSLIKALRPYTNDTIRVDTIRPDQRHVKGHNIQVVYDSYLQANIITSIDGWTRVVSVPPSGYSFSPMGIGLGNRVCDKTIPSQRKGYYAIKRREKRGKRMADIQAWRKKHNKPITDLL